MKVLLAIDFPSNPSAPKGGVEAVSVNLVKGLSAIDDSEVSVVTFVSGTDEVENWQGATIHRLQRPPGSVLTASLTSARKALINLIDQLNPDILHAHDTYGLMTATLTRVRVFTVHGFIHGDIRVSSTRFRFLKSLVWKYFETRAWSQQPNVVSISPYVREKLSRHSDASIFDIDNPISEKMFDVERKVVSNRIFCAGVISRRKNTLGLIKAVQMLRTEVADVNLVLAGDITEEDYGAKVVEYIKTNNLASHVSMLGGVTMERVREELQKAAVFALVSREENSPMGIEEAMAVGVPVVTSNRCGMPYMVRHGIHGFLTNQENPADIARCISRILSNPELAQKMSLASQDTACRRFHPDVVAEHTYSLYRELLETD